MNTRTILLMILWGVFMLVGFEIGDRIAAKIYKRDPVVLKHMFEDWTI